ncbi:hypothetical protein D3C75_1245690 [compost metagenome]
MFAWFAVLGVAHLSEKPCEKPAIGSSCLNERHHKFFFEVLIGLPGLPPIKPAFKEHVQWMLLAVVSRKMDLRGCGSERGLPHFE